MAADNGEEKLLAVARHIAKTLGQNESMADDILQIFSTFDGRFSREKLSDKIGGAAAGGDGDHLRPRGAFDSALNSIDRQISRYVAAEHPIWSDSADSAAFLDSIDELLSAVSLWTHLAHNGDKTAGACLPRAEELTGHAMFRLADEFRLLMERGGESFEPARRPRRYESTGDMSFDSEEEELEEGDLDEPSDDQIPVAQPLTDYDVVIDALPSGIIGDLHKIAKRMVVAGYGKDCSHAYSVSRREFLEESVSRLGLEKLSGEEVQRMTWQETEDRIERWIKASTVALRILFPSERRLCDRVFLGFSSAADFSFMEVCRVVAVQILSFADAVAIGSRAPERLFKVLDLFETVRDLLPEFEANFSDQYCVFLRNEAVAVWNRLGEAIRGIFMELENLIRRDPAKTPVPRGGLHPITRYVMNYVRAACQSRETLEQVFEEGETTAVAGSSSLLSVQMAWIMELLESNLEVKSEIYGDPALRCIFMMNNGRYIVQKVKDSELGSLLGDDWIRKHNAKIKQLHSSYSRNSWNKVLNVLKPDNGSAASNAAGKPVSMKEKMKLFNIQLEDICKNQSQWVIVDEQLSKDLRISVANLMLPAYRNFIARFQNAPDVGKHAERYMKYGLEDVEIRINELFQGGNGSSGGRK